MKRKNLKCNCGGTISESRVMLEGFLIDAFICNKCSETTLSPESAKQLIRLRDESVKIDSERKVIRIGNSIGVTLPSQIEEVGFREGQIVDIHLIGDHEILIKPKSKN